MDEKDLQDYIDWAKRGNLSNSAAARYFELSGLAGNDFKVAMSQMPMEVSQEPYIQEQPEKQTDPYAGFVPIKEDEIKGQFDVDIDFIDSNLMQKPEEEAVGELRNKYSRYGFKFEEATPGFDFVNVTAPNGEKRKFDTSRHLMSDSDKQFYTDKAVDRNEWRFSGGDLVSFMNENMVEDAKKVNDLAKANFLETPPFLGVENIQTESKEINEASNSLQERLNQYDEFVKAHEVAILNGEQKVADELVGEIRDQKKDLEIETSNLRGRSEAFTSNVGRYYAIKEEQGTDVGALASLFAGYGVEELVEGITELALLGGTMTGPLAGMMLTNSAYREKAIKDSKDTADFSDFGSFVQEMAGVSDEKRNEFEGRNLATQVLSGVARSLPSFISPSKVFNVFALTGQTLSSFNDMTSGPEWDDVSETKKTAFAAPFIFTQVALERYGFRNVKGVNSFSARLLTRIFGKTVGKIGAKSFAEVVEQDISSSIARAGAVTANAFVSEAETGLFQEVSSDALKRVWNLFEEKAEFEVAETTGEYINQALTSALHEGLGGILLGSRAAYRSAKYSFSDKEMLDLDFFRDKNFAGLREMNRSHKVSLGEMTKEEARKESQADKDLLEIMGQVPSDASVSTQKQIFRKLQREKGLKDSISKKGSRMAAKEQAELEKVQQEIKEIGETYDQLTSEQKEAELKEITKPIEDPTSGGVTVETAEGEVVEITPEDATPEETQQADAAPIAEESQEGVQLSLFDESTESQSAEETQEDPEALDQQESIPEPASIDIASATPESMEAAGFSTEFISLISRVQESLGGNLSRNEGDKFVNHKSLASMSKAVEGIEGTPLAFGEFVYGIANRETGEIHLLDTNSVEFTDKVKEAAAKLSSSYKIPSAVDLVAEELVTHYLLQDFFGKNGTKRKDFYNQLVKLAKTNKALANLIEGVKLDYPSSRFSSEQIQEEIIAAFFVDYVKGSNKYTNIWQKVKNWFNNQFAGKRVIKNESDLISVANNVSNIISGTSVKIDTGKKTASEAKPGDAVMSRSQGFTYLNNTEIYYDFNRQSGVEMADWTVGRPSGYTGEAKKVKVNDFYHFRNWYNKITANQEFPGIVTNMYFLKDGKKHIINPPKPKLDSEGNKVKMERIASFGQLKRNRRARNEAQDLELRRQYSALGKELGEIWRSSPLALHTSLPNFTPEGATESLDFEGLVIAKKNLQAAIASGVTEEQLKEMKGRFSTVSKKDNPELFNMSGLVRLGEAGSGNAVADGEVVFARSTGTPASKDHMRHFTKGSAKKIGSSEELNGVRAVDLGYDSTWFEKEKKNPSGIKKQNDLKLTGKGVDPKLKNNRIITSHLTPEDAGTILGALERQAAMDAKEKGLKAGDRGQVAITFNTLGNSAIAGNPYIASKISTAVKERLAAEVESGKMKEATAVQLINGYLNQSSNKIGFTNIPNGRTLVRQKVDLKEEIKGSEQVQGPGRPSFSYEWNLKTISEVNEFLDYMIKGEIENPFSEAKKTFINRIASLIDYQSGYDFAAKNNLIDPFLTSEVSGHLISYRMIPYTVSEEGYVPELNLTVSKIPGDIGFKGALVSKTIEFETSMKFMPSLHPINEIFEGINNISDAKRDSARPANIQGEIQFSRSAGRDSKKPVDMAGNTYRSWLNQPKNNLGDIRGAVWEQREQSRSEDLKDLWMVRLQDKYRRVFKLQEDVAKETKGQVREREDFRLAEETMYGKAAEDLDKLDGAVENLGRTLSDNGIRVEELDEYLYALHAKERNAVILERSGGENEEGSGKSNEWADGVLNSLSEPQRAKFEEIAGLVREIQQDTRDSMVGLGLETQETIDAFEEMFKDYVPLQGIAKDEDNIEFSPYPNGRTGFSVSGRSTKKAKGRFNEASNIVAQVISQNAAVRIKGRTNEALNSLFNLVKENPNENVWQILDKEENSYRDDDPNIVSVRVNGIQKAIRFKDASYAQSLRAMNLPNTNKFVKFLGTLNSWLRAAFTSRNPEFVISNFSRDIQAAVFNASAESDIEGGFLNGTGAMKRIFKMVGPSIKALTKDQVGANADPMIMKYYSEFKEDGGKTGWAYQKSLEDIASDLEIDDSGKTSAQKILGTPKRMLEFVEGINDAFENSIRLSSYIAAREGGVSRAKAAQFAKNITVNFNKQGEWGTAMNATFLFFNASVQGTARLGRSLGKIKPAERPDGSRREWYERATGAQKAATGLVLLNGMLTLLAQAGSEEDEDGVLYYNKIPDYIKERNMIIMRPDGENYWKIPMPYGYNIFANIGTVAVETAAGDRDPLEGLAFLASAVVNAFSPISFGESSDLARKAAKSAIPTALKPFFDAFAFNETYFGGPVKAEQYPFGTPKPNSSMSFRSPEELKQFFSWINEATGGSESVPGVLDLNPDGAWYILEYYLCGMGKFVERSIETTRKIASDTEESPVDLDFNDVPMMRIIYGEPSKYYDFQKYKDREVEIKQLVEEYKTEKKEDAGDRYKAIGTLNEYLKKINKALKVVRAEKRKAKTISGYAERISKTQELMERERKLVMLFNKKYDSLRGE